MFIFLYTFVSVLLVVGCLVCVLCDMTLLEILLEIVSFGVQACFFVRVCLGEACWWTIHPASKQRSEGEKVRVGDDLILVSVSSERYLVSHWKRMCAHSSDC